MRRADWSRTEPGAFHRRLRPGQPTLRGWLAQSRDPRSQVREAPDPCRSDPLRGLAGIVGQQDEVSQGEARSPRELFPTMPLMKYSNNLVFRHDSRLCLSTML